MNSRHREYYLALSLSIVYYRRREGLTQEALAEQVNISRTHLGNIEAPGANKSLSLNLLFDIADALHVHPHQLFSLGLPER